MLQFAQWCNNSRLAEAIRDSPWIFPTLEIVHLLGLAVLGGTILIVDLRMLGFGLKQLSSAQLAAQVSPWTRAALAAMLTSGALMFTSEAIDCYNSLPFRVKMVLLLAAATFMLTVRQRVIRGGTGASGPWIERLTGMTSLGLWTGVAAAGRTIAFW